MLNGTTDTLRHAIESYRRECSDGAWTDDAGDLADSGTALADAAHALLDELVQPTNLQALALARLMRDRPGAQVVVHRDVFDLPSDYWLAVIGLDGFQCGIGPDGSVSS